MRSPREIAFRLRQEATNASRLVYIPRFRLREPLVPEAILPGAAGCAELIKESRNAAELTSLADKILRHRFPVFGETIETGPDIDWRRDYRHGRSSGLAFFRRVPYLDFDAVGDHKWIWELNRHQHLVVLAQAFLLSGRGEYLREIEREVESWIVANPFAQGINWASALEVAFRALSWIWVDHLIGPRLPNGARARLQSALWQHARHLESNLSVYFSPNTHLLGEALALYAIGRLYPGLSGARRFEQTGRRIVNAQLDFQIRPDGSHFEQSTYYHVYALDMFLLYYVLAGRPEWMNAKLRGMAEYLDALAGPARILFACGDDDGGRLFHPYGERDRFCRATLTTCANLFPDLGFESCPEDAYQQAAWWLGPGIRASAPRDRPWRRHAAFPDSGMVVLTYGRVQVLFDAGPFGWGGAGHSHADALNLLIRRGDDTVLYDPGTFTYVTDSAARNWFRGTAAHNTVCIDDRDQADPVKPFRWENKPAVRLNRSGESFADAQAEYSGFTHRRRVLLCGERACIVVDDVTGPAGDHVLEQFWNAVNAGAIVSSERQSIEDGWRSCIYGARVRTSRVVVRKRSSLPARFVTVILPGGPMGELNVGGAGVRIGDITAEFPEGGEPCWRTE